MSARLHIGKDGTITVLTGKVEMGQGSRAELTQAAAEELRVPGQPDPAGHGRHQPGPRRRHHGRQPHDALDRARRAAGRRGGPPTARRPGLPALERRPGAVAVRDGQIAHAASQRSLTYADLARSDDAAKAFGQTVPADVTLTPVDEWKVLGTSVPRPNRRDLVTGAHQFPSDLSRPGMLYGKVLRPPSYGAQLAVRRSRPGQGDAGRRGGSGRLVRGRGRAHDVPRRSAPWKPSRPRPSGNRRRIPPAARSSTTCNSTPTAARRRIRSPTELTQAAKTLRQTYHVAYVQHAPLEPRTALAEWTDGKLTVWTGTQNPFGYHRELARAFRLPNDHVRVIVPDFGCGFGGKHTGEAAVEAARLAQAAGRPVLLRWTREEEFTWAYFRPAAVIDVEASLDADGPSDLVALRQHQLRRRGGRHAVPDRQARCRFVRSDSPLRQGSYRALAATANNFARECFMDELAAAAGADPLDFRLAPREAAAAGRARGSGQAVRLARAGARSRSRRPRRRPGLRHGEGLVRGRLRRDRRRSAAASRSRSCTSARSSSAARS